MDGQVKIELCILILMLIVARILYLIYNITNGYTKYEPDKRTVPCKIMVCIGSGGHTTEMLRLLKGLDFSKYSPRFYIVAMNDSFSIPKVEQLEDYKRSQDYKIYRIPRPRAVLQSYFTSTLTTAFSVLYSIPMVLMLQPDVVLCNGPGTCIPICVICFLMRVAFLKNIRIVFVESFCRTRTLSLTGKILAYIADNFVVQWPGLKKKLKRADYLGKLM